MRFTSDLSKRAVGNTDRDEPTVRDLVASDLSAARALALGAFGISPYAERVIELLQQAGRGTDLECRALVAESVSPAVTKGRGARREPQREIADQKSDAVARVLGLALYGEIAGTSGGAKLHLCESACAGVERALGIRRRLIAAVVERVSQSGARYIVAEVPDDPWFSAMRASLGSEGFVEEARVRDLWRDGVAMVFLRRSIAASPDPGARR